MVQTSVAITKSNVFTQVHANIYNLVNNRSNVPDPNDSTGARKFVYTREPNFMAKNFKGFPLIVVQDEKHSQETNAVADGTKAFSIDELRIIVMAQDKVADSSGNPSGFDTLNTISDDILETLNNTTNASTLRNNGLKHHEFSSVDFEWGEIDGQPVFRREFILRFKQMRVIS